MQSENVFLPFRVIVSRDSRPINLDVIGSIFIGFYNSARNAGAGLIVRNEFLDEKILAAAFSKIQTDLNLNVRTCAAKIIGRTEELETTITLLQKAGISIVASVPRRSNHFKIIYYAVEGRIRLEKESAVAAMKSKIKVLIVDDSATIRRLFASIFEKEGSFEIRAVEKPSLAEDAIRSFKPNVITLDIHMPEMNGVQLLKKIGPKYGIPTVMITSVSTEEGTLILDALEAGAIDYIQKPTMHDLRNAGPIICEKIKIAAQYRRRKASAPNQRVSLSYSDKECLIAIGSSTGGTEAVREILVRLPADIPPIVITQHIPATFSRAWADRLNGLCPFEVKEAVDGDAIKRGRVLIAPGGKQMRATKARDGGYSVKVTEEGPINRHCPSVDVLFDSVAEIAGMHAIGIILTGMGADGAKGLLKMRSSGARTIAQDESSCVVFGMPKEAIKLGAAKEIVPLGDIPEMLAKWLREGKAA